MSESEFVTLVQRASGIGSEEHAAQVAEAALAELGRSISRGEAEDLAEPLPTRFALALTDVDQRLAEPEGLTEFLVNVSEEGDLPGQERATIRGVFAAVSEYAGAEEVENAAAQLPPEYGAIIEPGEVPVTETFVDTVRSVSELDEAAPEATEATLTVLGERLSQGEAEDVAMYLHGDAESWLVEYATLDAEEFPPEQFVSKAAREADVSEQRAEEYVQGVTRALGKEVPDREIDRANPQLPDEYGTLFDLD